ncbi:carboxylesterase [Xylariaceae sp. FL0255]|nr:carboxylesterase [Xylariaceae sp. FL0255]
MWYGPSSFWILGIFSDSPVTLRRWFNDIRIEIESGFSVAQPSFTSSCLHYHVARSIACPTTMKAVLSWAAVALLAVGHTNAKCIKKEPKVDLGYEIHQASVNDTGDYYIFSNVPYAQDPIGELRFKEPQAIPKQNSKYLTINKGETYYECVQGYPEWVIEEEESSSSKRATSAATGNFSNPTQSESCLLLDIYVPAKTFERGAEAEAAVLVWIHGGGFTFGSKTSSGDPAGLISRAELDHQEGLIFVSLNYRLGLYGWLAGEGVTPNLGLYDQRFALEWIQQNIHLFGGNPERVTVMGESAGASSILHQITAYGGSKSVPFHQAIPQSPAFQFNINPAVGYETTFAVASKVTGKSITTVDQLRELNSSILSTINEDTVYLANHGDFNFGPAPDGTFVPKLPQILLSEGKFAHDVNLLISHCGNESVEFAPEISTEAQLLSGLQATFPEASNTTINTLLTDIYPPPSASTSWKTEFARAVQFTTDAFFACTTTYLAHAKGNTTYNYLFAYPPGYHAEDTPYVFFNGDTSTSDDGLPVNAKLATALQEYIVAFVMRGDPNANPEGLPNFPEYGKDSIVLDLSTAGVTTTVDDMRNPRCVWWQKAMIEGLV